MPKAKGLSKPDLKLTLPSSDEHSVAKFLTESGTFKVGDLLVNKDGLRMVSENGEEQPPLVKPSDNQLTLADIDTIKVIGKGSGGIVQLVRHKFTGQFFAMKVIQMNVLESVRKQIAQELKINQSSQSPYVVVWYQSFYDNGVFSIIMEYMDGGSLSDFLRHVKTIPEPYLAAICRQVLQGLIYLHHEKHIIHRDLKPSNLLINHTGGVKITDFGVSAILASTSGQRDTFVGTCNYMSPERISGGAYGSKSDIWSLGLVLLECASGCFPYMPPNEQGQWGNFYELLEAIVDQPPPCAPPDQFSPEFCSFISACVQKDPIQRKSAPELLKHPFVNMYSDLDINLASYFTTSGLACHVKNKTHVVPGSLMLGHANFGESNKISDVVDENSKIDGKRIRFLSGFIHKKASTITGREKILMEEMAPAVAIPFSIGTSNAPIASHMEITRLKLITDTAATLLAEPAEEGCSSGDPPEVEAVDPEDNPGLFTTWVGGTEGVVVHEIEDDDTLSVGTEQVLDSSCSLSVVSDTSSLCGEEILGLEAAFEISTPISIDIDKTIENVHLISRADAPLDPMVDLLDAPPLLNGLEPKPLPFTIEFPTEQKIAAGPRVFDPDCVPLWGSVSICGRRPEMEDAMAAIPRFTKIPVWMLTSDTVVDKTNQSLSHLNAHFFGVYDGHGGSQVANYCRERVHSALIEEIETAKESCSEEVNSGDKWQAKWERAFTSCFLKVDAEVGGKVSRGDAGIDGDVPEGGLEPIAPETVGSTAVVGIVCSSHIIVANCGDSRAVLCRGKEPLPLSVDHKPNREDEYARIEAAGGKVIQWNGFRVFGVLAMSRSIGDRYLKPWIIPEPEVMFIPRKKEDECLILASDGLWDVMTNEEVCDVARRRILSWHKKNGTNMTSSTERGEGTDPAAQAAAECLSKLASQKGSKDNITVIVVDLKPHRRFKSKT
ncbi:hypothetical protein H6P81_004716 [Aristolochia fimbriata]|uniref:Protein-serine/threonine phosphatase n=1 Tax=Aristolochia fimbriata TaxID=158543 RepID=A0AAV7EW21_ARIFI|nr:hypothetical protein H6P81_004716 [Aristolochia fimbriata]